MLNSYIRTEWMWFDQIWVIKIDKTLEHLAEHFVFMEDSIIYNEKLARKISI